MSASAFCCPRGLPGQWRARLETSSVGEAPDEAGPQHELMADDLGF